jgi:hypothetical protein
MFLDAMRDFLHLVAGHVPEDKLGLVPRLDLVSMNCRAIASAWEARQFVGKIEGDYS